MSTDIATTTTDPGIDVLPPARPMQSEAVGQLMAHAEAMSTAKQLADALCDTDMVPTTYRGKPGNGAAAILYGAELGLTPIQSLQQIFVVHGSPAIYARTSVALVMRHGVKVQTVSSTDEQVTVRATRGDLVEESTWDIKRAERAGYTTNKKYATDPQSMLYAKAAMEVCRKIAPDVLLGIAYSREELELEEPQRVTAQRAEPTKARGVAALAARVTPIAAVETPAPPPTPEPATAAVSQGMSAATRKKWEASLQAALGEADCTDTVDQAVVIAELAGLHEATDMRDLDDDELRTVVGKLDAARKEGALGSVVTEILNIEALRADAATTSEGN